MTLIEVANVSLKRRGNLVLNNVSFRLLEGELLGLVGRNGAGKTTLLRLLCGLANPSSGTIRVLGKTVKSAKDLANLVGVVHQHSGLPEMIKARELFDLEVRARGLKRHDVDELLEVAKINPFMEEMLGRLSSGTQRKVAIIKALLHRPRILLLDEPTAGLDPVVRQGIWKVLLRMKNGAGCAVIATNDLHEAQVLCDRILVIKDGTIIARERMGTASSTLTSLMEKLGEE